jgi:hemin uptake protein HemP
MQPCDPNLYPKQTDTAVTIPRINSEHLLKGQCRVVIVHNRDEYVLRITRQGKLILTK